MPVYKRCGKCYADNSLKNRLCQDCRTALGSKFSVKVRDAITGRWQTKVVPSLKLAREVEAKFKVGIIEGSLLPAKQKRTKDVSFPAYLEWAKSSKKTWKDDEQRWTTHVEKHDHKTPAGILRIIQEMHGTGDYKPGTVDHVLKLIRRVYNWHINNGLWSGVNPCDGVKLPKYDNRISNPLSTQEAANLIKYLATHHNRRSALVVLFALFTGRRKGEILNLTWEDINFDLEIITCRDTKNGASLSFPLNGGALAVLDEARKLRTGKYVFPSSSGNHYYNVFNHTWARLKKRLLKEGVVEKPFRFHDLRHTYASHLASSGKVDIYTLKKLLGHKDITLTERYAHLIDGRLRKGTEIQDSLYI